MDELVDVTMTGPNAALVQQVARTLVERRLIACANIVPQVTSIYAWDGEVCEEPEALAVMHTRAECFEAIAELVAQVHPYTVPQLVALPLQHSTPEYRQWVLDMTDQPELDEEGPA